MTQFVPTTSDVTRFEMILKELNSNAFQTTMLNAAKAGWTFQIFNTSIESINALFWTIEQLLLTDMFILNPFKVLVRGDLDYKNEIFEIGISWCGVSDIQFIENDDFEIEHDRLTNSLDITNTTIAKFNTYNSEFTCKTKLFSELIDNVSANILTYIPTEFDQIMLDNLKNTLLRYATRIWSKDIHIISCCISPYSESLTLREQWMMYTLSEYLLVYNVSPVRIDTPDGTFIGLVRQSKIVFQLDIY